MPTAIITGGTSGIGLAVAEALLAQKANWKCYLIYLKRQGDVTPPEIPDCEIHEVDVTNYDGTAAVFQSAFKSSGRQIDFVFANAGMVERESFYEPPQSTAEDEDEDAPPPRLPQTSIDVNLKSVVDTVQLAVHYMRKSKSKGKGCSIVCTSSSGGLYPTYYLPLYAAAKHGVVGIVRSAHDRFYVEDGIRLNAINPGTVRTGLISQAEWDQFPQDCFTPLKTVSDTVLGLVAGQSITDDWGETITDGNIHGLTVELNGDKIFFRKAPDYSNESMARVMEACKMVKLEDEQAK